MKTIRFAKWLETSEWSVTKIATVLEVSKAAVYGWIRGDFAPSTNNLRRLGTLSDGVIQVASFPSPKNK
jgi:predicted transcriptional regulator